MLVRIMVIALAGATGTIGMATLKRLVQLGHTVLELSRQDLGSPEACQRALSMKAAAVKNPIGAVISCIASRTGQAEDAWAVDYRVNANLLAAARRSGIKQFVLLSAICVQKPRLAFQHAKLKFEGELKSSSLRYSIVRPTAFFKSLSGQLQRVKQGGVFYVFGNGRLTRCKPISDEDLAEFLVDCLEKPERHDRTLVIGGPGPAVCPMDQITMIAEILGRPVKVRHVPIGLLKLVIAGLEGLGRIHSGAAKKADYARIGLYYATESMLAWDPEHKQYSEDLTPSFGRQTLLEHYRQILTKDPA
jgi:divinyl chlorophyllide a 8-vinyl-reductase